MARTALALLVVTAVAYGGCGSSSDHGGDGGAPGDLAVPPGADLAHLGDGGGGSGDGGSACLGADVLAALGKDHLLAGAAMADATAKAAPFDLRYQYLSGGIADGSGPCTSCASGCTSANVTCANSGPGCAWWGCWQYDQDPPGAFVRGFVQTAQSDGQIPMFTYYMILQASGVGEGAPEVTDAANDPAFMARYLADFRFFLQQIGQARAVVHVEPDFWGYAEQVSEDPHGEPAAVASANPTDCGSLENSIAGLGRCVIAMARKYAPNALIGLHASSWGTKMPALENSDPNFDVTGQANQLGDFLLAAGAADGDLVIADISDRDAGYYQSIGKNTWWDDTNATLPNFHQGFAWSKALAEHVNKPILWWQIPVGNMSLPDQPTMWKDNRVDYFFAHPQEVAAGHGIGFAFGAGDGNQTTPETDGGNLISKVKAYGAAPQALCN